METYREEVWIIQRCINTWKNSYEAWLRFCEQLMTRDKMIEALRECEQQWPNYEFRGHNKMHISQICK